MGLAERRAMTAFQNDVYPGALDKMRKAAGFDVAVDVDWDSFAGSPNFNPDYFSENILEAVFIPIENVFVELCSDEMGREALKESLETISIKCEVEASRATLAFEGGTLSIARGLVNCGGLNSVWDADAMQKLLEENL